METDRDLRHEHGRALQPSIAQVRKGVVGATERIGPRVHADAGLWRYGQEVDRVLAGEVGDGNELPLLPQDSVREAWNVAHVDAAADDPSTFPHGAQRRRHEVADWRENDGAVERHWRALVRAAGPRGSEAQG